MKKLHLNCFMKVCPSLSKLIPRQLWKFTFADLHNIIQLPDYYFKYSERACLHPGVSFDHGLIIISNTVKEHAYICTSKLEVP